MGRSPVPASGQSIIDIILVDDAAKQARKVCSLLEQNGYSVAWAHACREALEMARTMRPSLVIADAAMPGMTGPQLCAAIRKDPELAETPVLVTTSPSEPAETLDALACGASNFISKPYDGDLLLGRVHRMLTNGHKAPDDPDGSKLDVVLAGRRYSVAPDTQRIMDFLTSTFEDAEKRSGLVERSSRRMQDMLRTIAGMEKRYRSMLEASAGAILVLERDGTVSFANHAAEELFRREAKRLVGKPCPFPLETTEDSAEIDLTLADGSVAVVELRVVETDWQGRDAYLASLWDVTENVRLRELSLHDELTGLHNRRGFIALAEQQLKVARRSDTGLVMLFADMDGLKGVNDTFGHDAGDDALRELARLMRDTLRDSDIVARVGGDEFAALLIGVDEEAANLVVERLDEALLNRSAEGVARYRLEASIGCVRYDPEQHTSLSTLIAKADELMYAEKQRRRRERRTSA
jgi:two-component system cell cycle response regulator